MEVEEMNKCLSKFYVSVRKQDGSFYKKTSLLSIRAALDRQLKSPPYNKKFSICDGHLFSEANQTLNSHLLVSDVKIAGTVHKNPLTSETIKKLYEKGAPWPIQILVILAFNFSACTESKLGSC